MYKLFLTFLLCTSISFAGVINGVALTVNDDPITLYDVDQLMVTKNIDKSQAVSLLVDKILYEQLLEKNNITADIFDVNEYVEKLAQSNNMDVFAFKSIVRQKYPDYSVFEEETKNVVTRQKLIKKLVQGQLKIATQEDMKLHYENNKQNYSTARTVEVVQYLTDKKASLIAVIKSPLLVPQDVQRNPLSLEVKQLDPQMQYLLNNTNENSFTPIFTSNKMYNALFILKKEGTDTLDFEVVKNKVFNEVMALREKKYLKDFFEKQKLTADIKIIR
jgi:hypothetical protein